MNVKKLQTLPAVSIFISLLCISKPVAYSLSAPNFSPHNQISLNRRTAGNLESSDTLDTKISNYLMKLQEQRRDSIKEIFKKKPEPYIKLTSATFDERSIPYKTRSFINDEAHPQIAVEKWNPTVIDPKVQDYGRDLRSRIKIGDESYVDYLKRKIATKIIKNKLNTYFKPGKKIFESAYIPTKIVKDNDKKSSEIRMDSNTEQGSGNMFNKIVTKDLDISNELAESVRSNNIEIEETENIEPGDQIDSINSSLDDEITASNNNSDSNNETTSSPSENFDNEFSGTVNDVNNSAEQGEDENIPNTTPLDAPNEENIILEVDALSDHEKLLEPIDESNSSSSEASHEINDIVEENAETVDAILTNSNEENKGPNVETENCSNLLLHDELKEANDSIHISQDDNSRNENEPLVTSGEEGLTLKEDVSPDPEKNKELGNESVSSSSEASDEINEIVKENTETHDAILTDAEEEGVILEENALPDSGKNIELVDKSVSSSSEASGEINEIIEENTETHDAVLTNAGEEGAILEENALSDPEKNIELVDESVSSTSEESNEVDEIIEENTETPKAILTDAEEEGVILKEDASPDSEKSIESVDKSASSTSEASGEINEIIEENTETHDAILTDAGEEGVILEENALPDAEKNIEIVEESASSSSEESNELNEIIEENTEIPKAILTDAEEEGVILKEDASLDPEKSNNPIDESASSSSEESNEVNEIIEDNTETPKAISTDAEGVILKEDASPDPEKSIEPVDESASSTSEASGEINDIIEENIETHDAILTDAEEEGVILEENALPDPEKNIGLVDDPVSSSSEESGEVNKIIEEKTETPAAILTDVEEEGVILTEDVSPDPEKSIELVDESVSSSSEESGEINEIIEENTETHDAILTDAEEEGVILEENALPNPENNIELVDKSVSSSSEASGEINEIIEENTETHDAILTDAGEEGVILEENALPNPENNIEIVGESVFSSSEASGEINEIIEENTETHDTILTNSNEGSREPDVEPENYSNLLPQDELMELDDSIISQGDNGPNANEPLDTSEEEGVILEEDASPDPGKNTELVDESVSSSFDASGEINENIEENTETHDAILKEAEEESTVLENALSPDPEENIELIDESGSSSLEPSVEIGEIVEENTDEIFTSANEKSGEQDVEGDNGLGFLLREDLDEASENNIDKPLSILNEEAITLGEDASSASKETELIDEAIFLSLEKSDEINENVEEKLESITSSSELSEGVDGTIYIVNDDAPCNDDIVTSSKEGKGEVEEAAITNPDNNDNILMEDELTNPEENTELLPALSCQKVSEDIINENISTSNNIIEPEEKITSYNDENSKPEEVKPVDIADSNMNENNDTASESADSFYSLDSEELNGSRFVEEPSQNDDYIREPIQEQIEAELVSSSQDLSVGSPEDIVTHLQENTDKEQGSGGNEIIDENIIDPNDADNISNHSSIGSNELEEQIISSSKSKESTGVIGLESNSETLEPGKPIGATFNEEDNSSASTEPEKQAISTSSNLRNDGQKKNESTAKHPQIPIIRLNSIQNVISKKNPPKNTSYSSSSSSIEDNLSNEQSPQSGEKYVRIPEIKINSVESNIDNDKTSASKESDELESGGFIMALSSDDISSTKSSERERMIEPTEEPNQIPEIKLVTSNVNSSNESSPSTESVAAESEKPFSSDDKAAEFPTQSSQLPNIKINSVETIASSKSVKGADEEECAETIELDSEESKVSLVDYDKSSSSSNEPDSSLKKKPNTAYDKPVQLSEINSDRMEKLVNNPHSSSEELDHPSNVMVETQPIEPVLTDTIKLDNTLHESSTSKSGTNSAPSNTTEFKKRKKKKQPSFKNVKEEEIVLPLTSTKEGKNGKRKPMVLVSNSVVINTDKDPKVEVNGQKAGKNANGGSAKKPVKVNDHKEEYDYASYKDPDPPRKFSSWGIKWVPLGRLLVSGLNEYAPSPSREPQHPHQPRLFKECNLRSEPDAFNNRKFGFKFQGWRACGQYCKEKFPNKKTIPVCLVFKCKCPPAPRFGFGSIFGGFKNTMEDVGELKALLEERRKLKEAGYITD